MTAQERLNAVVDGLYNASKVLLWALMWWSIFQNDLNQATLCGVLLLLARQRSQK